MNETIIINGITLNILTILSAIFCVIFFLLSIAHALMMKKTINHFRAPTLEELRFGEEMAQRMQHEHIFNRPLQAFQNQVNEFIDDFNASNKLINKIGASGYFTAFLVSLLSFYLSL